MKVIELANGSRHELEGLARLLGEARKSLDLSTFHSELVKIGMSDGEVRMFWNAVDIQCSVRTSADANTRFASELGIALQTRMLPRNLLLFRLIELMCPDKLMIQMSVAPQRGEVRPGQWNFLDDRRKKILRLKVLPKRPRPLCYSAWCLD